MFVDKRDKDDQTIILVYSVYLHRIVTFIFRLIMICASVLLVFFACVNVVNAEAWHVGSTIGSTVGGIVGLVSKNSDASQLN